MPPTLAQTQREAQGMETHKIVGRIGNGLLQLKANPCMDCGGTFPLRDMEFDHRDPNSKDANISEQPYFCVDHDHVNGEVSECDLVCVSCHRLRTNIGIRGI